MSISGSLSAALSGLTAAGRAAQAVSSNISNAMTAGYGVREVELSSRVVGGTGNGVRVDGINRHSDPRLIENRRLSGAELGLAGARHEFLARMERAIGTPDDPLSLTGRTAALEGALIEAASRPDSEARLQNVLARALSLAGHLNDVSDAIQVERQNADRDIATAVERLNATLQQIADLNGRIARHSGGNTDPSALIDQRQVLVDRVAELVPVREVDRGNGRIALFTPGGAILIDGRPAEFGFAPSGIITPHMSVGGGTLSGLTINGRPVSTDAERGPIAGGRLAGLFDVRDVKAVEVQARLDAVARDLVERFQDPGVDPTLAVGDAGLFTDAGAAFAAVDEIGLAARVSVNALADPAQGGGLWRLRDGLGAAAPGPVGDATLLGAQLEALTQNRLPASGGFISQRSAAGLASDMLSGVATRLTAQESERTYLQAQTDALTEMELRGGVDTDTELQKLLLIEQSFAANARVISTIDDLIQGLLRI